MVLTIKIGILGKMGAGKTTLANEFIRQYPDFVKIAFADKIKELAADLFDMNEKDRQLLQAIGESMRKINPDVWINYAIKRARDHKYVIIDDVRYENEISALKREGFTIIYLDIDRDTQLLRLQDTYGDNYQHHANGDHHESERADEYQNHADIRLTHTTTEMSRTFVEKYLETHFITQPISGSGDIIRINNHQALDLELKLNVSTYGNQWNTLGDVLFKWRLDPSLYILAISVDYYISQEQADWIRDNLDATKNNVTPQYKLIVKK